MTDESKPYKHHDRSNNYHPDVLTNGWTKTSLLLHFDDAVVDANLNYKFFINEPITDLVFAEWITVSSGLVGSLMAVNEFNNEGQTTAKITALTPPAPPPAPINFFNVPVAIPTSTSQNTKYWRFLSDNNNYLSPSLAEPLMSPPINLTTINVKLFTVAGVPKTVAVGAYIQLFLWTYCCKA